MGHSMSRWQMVLAAETSTQCRGHQCTALATQPNWPPVQQRFPGQSSTGCCLLVCQQVAIVVVMPCCTALHRGNAT